MTSHNSETAELERALLAHDADKASGITRELWDEDNLDGALDTAALLAEGNDTALNVLVETLDASGVLHRFAGTMLLDRDAIDDVVQESLISVVESIGTYGGGSKFTTWAHTIVKRRVVDHLRRQRESAPLAEEDSPVARMSSVIATRTSIEDSLARLPQLYRQPVVLRDIQGLPYAEIASTLGRSVGTVKSQISRGRALMAGVLRAGPGQE